MSAHVSKSIQKTRLPNKDWRCACERPKPVYGSGLSSQLDCDNLLIGRHLHNCFNAAAVKQLLAPFSSFPTMWYLRSFPDSNFNFTHSPESFSFQVLLLSALFPFFAWVPFPWTLMFSFPCLFPSAPDGRQCDSKELHVWAKLQTLSNLCLGLINKWVSE